MGDKRAIDQQKEKSTSNQQNLSINVKCYCTKASLSGARNKMKERPFSALKLKTMAIVVISSIGEDRFLHCIALHCINLKHKNLTTNFMNFNTLQKSVLKD